MNGLLGPSVASALVRASGMLLSLLLSTVLTRALAPEGYGTYTFVLSITALLGIPVNFGLPLLVSRETARGIATQNITIVWTLWKWAHRFVLSLGTAMFALLILWLAITDQSDRSVWIWAGLLLPILGLAHLRSAAIRGLGFPVFSQAPEAVLRPALTIGLILGFSAVFGQELTPTRALSLNVLSSAAVFIVGIGFLIWCAPPRPPQNTWPRDPAIRKAWFLASVTLGLTVGAQTLGSNMDVVMLGFFTDGSEVGIYKVALNIGSLVGFGLQSINMILLPRIAALHAGGETEELQGLVTSAARIALTFTAIVCALLVPFGRSFVIMLFGEAYRDAYTSILIIGTGQLFGSCFGFVMLVVNVTGNERYALRGTVGFAFLNFILNALLIPLAGKEGAATATALSLAVLFLYLWYVAMRHARINTLAFTRPSKRLCR